jgi:hypothetical protein
VIIRTDLVSVLLPFSRCSTARKDGYQDDSNQ